MFSANPYYITYKRIIFESIDSLRMLFFLEAQIEGDTHIYIYIYIYRQQTLSTESRINKANAIF